MKLKLTRPLCVFDLETTGTNTAKDRIVEIALIKIHPDGSCVDKHKYINPQIPIPPGASAVHGITDEKVKDAPTFRQISKGLLNFISGCDFLGYNCLNFDVPMLVEEFHRVRVPHPFADANVVDAYKIFRKRETRTLSAALMFFCNEELKDAHTAHADTQATLKVLLGQLDRYPDLCHDVEGLSSYCQDDDVVDYNRRIIKREGEYLYNFGKHKGKRLLDEPSYAEWMLKQDFPEDTKATIRKIMVQVKMEV
jgi:DNA polymerase-3 subunit epsilon